MGCVPCRPNGKILQNLPSDEIDSGEQEEKVQEVLTYYRAENQIFKVFLTKELKSSSNDWDSWRKGC